MSHKFLIESQENDRPNQTSELFAINRVSKKVMETKKKLDHWKGGWKVVKRMVHPYEYVYSSPCKKKNICNYLPISRSYFKMKEIYQEFLTPYNIQTAFCLAEAPGGFVESLLQQGLDMIYGSSLISKDREVPDWNPKLLKNTHFHEVRGIQDNGDLRSFTNVVSIIRKIKRGSMDLVTGDGGFDTSDDYNLQEVRSFPLIYSEIYIALHLQKTGGCFICKLFDTFDRRTLSLIYLLSQSYESIHFYKPSMSRISNSEKYVVCEKFRGVPTETLNLLTHHFQDPIFECDLPSSFLQSIRAPIDSLASLQISSIERGISLLKQKKQSYKPSPLQLINGKKWCHNYKIPVNKDCVFL